MCLCSCVWYGCSLIPRPLPFLPSACVHNNTQNWKISGKLKLVFTPVHCYEHKRKVKMGEVLEQGYAWCMCVYDHVHVCVYKCGKSLTSEGGSTTIT